MVYNHRDQLVMSRDSVMRAQNKWTFIKYDALGRPIITGIINNSDSRTDWQGIFYDEPSPVLFETRDDGNLSGTGTGYSNNALPAHNIVQQYLTITYYDNYTYPGSLYNGANDYYNNSATGMVTGSKVNVLGTSVMLTKTTIYDKSWREAVIENEAYHGGTSLVSYSYDFQGQMTESLPMFNDYSNGNGLNLLRENYYFFDHVGRPISTWWWDNYEYYENGDIITEDYQNNMLPRNIIALVN